MQYFGGTTLANSTVSHGSSESSPRDWLGARGNFSVPQQPGLGITADIHCQSDCRQLSAFEFHKFQHHAQPGLTWEYVTGLYAGRIKFDSELQHQHVPFLLDMVALRLLDVPLR
jgi:hypothetical protein